MLNVAVIEKYILPDVRIKFVDVMPSWMQKKTANAWVARILCKMIPEHNGKDCIRWVGYISKVNGYGQCRVSIYYSGLGNIKVTTAHRVIYRLIRGPIPIGYHIDHECENRWCVNPYHLRPMPQVENTYLANQKRWHGDWPY